MSHYETITGRRIHVTGLSSREQRVLSALLAKFSKEPDWDVFAVYWQKVIRTPLARLSGSEKIRHVLYLIGEDLHLRLGIKQKLVAPPDYRDYLFDRIEERFGSRYRFCQETGIPQAFLSQVLSGQKDFSIATLKKVAAALDLRVALLPIAQLAGDPGGTEAPRERKASRRRRAR